MKYAHFCSMSSLQASLWKSLGLRAAIAEVCIAHAFVLAQHDPKITPLFYVHDQAKTSRDSSGLEIELQSALVSHTRLLLITVHGSVELSEAWRGYSSVRVLA